MALFSDKQKRRRRSSSGAGPPDAQDSVEVDAAFEKEADAAANKSTARQRTEIRAAAPRPGASKRPPGTLEKLAALHESRARLKRLCPEALKVVLEAFGVERGALLIYDPHRQCLVLAAERGIGPKGKECLRRVRRDDAFSWDMPLHGMLNERAYLIEDPAENRYVPQLVEGGNHALARVACVPIYRLRAPVGAFVLLAENHSRLTETEIRLSYVSLRYVAMIIDDARERDGMSAITGSEEEREEYEQTTVALVSSAEATAPGKSYSGLLREIPAALEQPVTDDAAPQEILLTEEVDGSRLAQVDSELTTAREAAREAGRQLEAAQNEVEANRRRIDELEADVNSLRAEAVAAREDLASAGNREEGVDALLAARAAEIAASKSRLAAMEVKVDASGGKIQELKTANSQLKAERAAALEEVARAGEYARSLETSIELRNAEAAELTAQLGAAQAKDEADKRAIEASRRAIEALTATTGRLEEDRRSLAERGRSLEKEVRTLKEAVAAHEETAREMGIELETALAESRAGGERERLLNEMLEQARLEWQAREAQLSAEIGKLAHEREALGQHVATAKASLQESSAALEVRAVVEAAALDEISRLRDREAAARQEANTRGEEAKKLTEKIAELDQVLERAAARSREIEAREAAARQEAEQWRAEAEKLGRGVSELDEQAQTAVTEAALVAKREQAARHEWERWREDAEKLQARTAALSKSLEAVQAEKAHLEERDKQTQAEAAQWHKTAQELEQRIAAVDQQRGDKEGEAAALREHVQQLEAELKTKGEERGDSGASVARLESERRAAYADAARAREDAAESERRMQELKSQRDEQAQRVAILEAAVARLETEQAIHSQQQHGRLAAEDKTEESAANGAAAGRSRRVSKSGEAGAAKGQAKTAMGQPKAATLAGAEYSPENERFVVVDPSEAVGDALASRLGPRARAIAATGSLEGVVSRLVEARPTVVAINLGSRGAAGGFNLLQALQQSETSDGVRLWGYVAPPQATKAIALGFIQGIPQPTESKDLVEWLTRLCGSGARVLSVGLEMDGLLNAREQLARDGISLSMAWDSKQGQELLEMVNPSSVVVNLDLARGDGYRTLGRLAVAKPKYSWVLCGGATPPAEAGSLVANGATQGSAAKFLALPDVGSALLEDLKRQALTAAGEASLSGKGRQRSRERVAVSAGRGRNAESGIRRSSALGSQRRLLGG